MHALRVAPAHIVFGQGDVDVQSTVSVLPEPACLSTAYLSTNQELPEKITAYELRALAATLRRICALCAILEVFWVVPAMLSMGPCPYC